MVREPGDGHYVSVPREQREWSWAPTSEDVAARRSHARQLEGLHVESVLYVNLDYDRERISPGSSGPRQVVEPAELADPTWRLPGCDSLDYGLELTTACGRIFSVTWDPPGPHEGLGLREAPLLSTLRNDANVALWDATDVSRWRSIIRGPVVNVDPHYLPWDAAPTGYWCPQVTLHFGSHRVELLLGEGDPVGTLRPSADNVLVLFDPDSLPSWVPTA